MTGYALVCTGRALDPDGQPVGDPCGKRITAYERWAGYVGETRDQLLLRARVSGWKVGPVLADGPRHVMCPTCGRADPVTAAMCRDLERGLR